jgi:hypothetical protein
MEHLAASKFPRQSLYKFTFHRLKAVEIKYFIYQAKSPRFYYLCMLRWFTTHHSSHRGPRSHKNLLSCDTGTPSLNMILLHTLHGSNIASAIVSLWLPSFPKCAGFQLSTRHDWIIRWVQTEASNAIGFWLVATHPTRQATFILSFLSLSFYQSVHIEGRTYVAGNITIAFVRSVLKLKWQQYINTLRCISADAPFRPFLIKCRFRLPCSLTRSQVDRDWDGWRIGLSLSPLSGVLFLWS